MILSVVVENSRSFKMETNSQLKFVRFVINFYRILGITFGGIALDKNGNIIKSKFWFHFGWFGFTIYSIPIIFFIIVSLSFLLFKIINSTLYTIIGVMLYIISLLMVCSTLIIHHKYGFQILNIFIEHSLTKFTKLKMVKIIWIIHVITNVLIFILQSVFFPDTSHISISFINNLLLIPLYYSISFISWIVSTNFTENIKIVRKHLIDNATKMKLVNLAQANNFMLINYKIINKIDNFLAFGFITSAIGIILSIMTSVFLEISIHRVNMMRELFAFGLVFQLQLLTQLILNCFINGRVYEETMKLLNDLDNLNINVNDNLLVRALILFRTTINKNKCGFTIGGFAPWNKLTLLQVTCYLD